MRPVNHILWVVFLTLTCVPAKAAEPPAAIPPSEFELSLATCHGRYTAVLEHSRLVSTEHDGARMRRDWIEAMMNTYLTAKSRDRGYAIAMMKPRVEARSQMRNLFRNTDFEQNPRRQRLAQAQVRRLLIACDTLLIGPRFHGM